jgi:hypothetical protein
VSLTIRLQLHRKKPPAGEVVVQNRGATPIRLWRVGNSWGDETLSFDVIAGSGAHHLSRQFQVYTRNVPSSFLLDPGAEHRIAFDLGDGTWKPGEILSLLNAPEAQLLAIYDVPASPEALAHGVWTGQVRSSGVRLGDG